MYSSLKIKIVNILKCQTDLRISVYFLLLLVRILYFPSMISKLNLQMKVMKVISYLKLLVLVFMVRNMVGKFIWFGELFYKLFCPVKKDIDETTKDSDTSKMPIIKEEEAKQRGLSHEILSSPRSGGANQELELLLQQQFDIEEQYESKYNKNKTIQTRELSSPGASSTTSYEVEEDGRAMNRINTIKMFLLNTGILNLKDLNKVVHFLSL